MMNVRVDFDAAGFASIAALLHPSSVERAARRASKKTAGWVRIQIARQVGSALKLPRRILATRGKFYDKGWREGHEGGMAFKVWFGLDPLMAERIGAPQRMVKGYRVKQHKFATAFIPKRGRYKDKLMHRTTSARMPIMRARVEIDQAGTRAFNALAPRIQARYMELLKHEMEYEVMKMQGRV